MSAGDETPPTPGIVNRIDEVKRAVLFGTGYRNPPKDKQFKKGQSGNPEGRPKKEPATPPVVMPTSLTAHEREVLDELETKETLVVKGKRITATRRKAVLLAQTNAAVAGNPLAQRNMLTLSAELAKKEAIVAADEAARSEAHYLRIERWKTLQQETWDEFLTDGVPSNRLLPHPEDILLNRSERTYYIRGPIDAETLRCSVDSRIRRDSFLLDLTEQGDWPNLEDRYNYARFAAAASYNSHLPKRWQLSAEGMLSGWPKLSEKRRAFEKEVFDQMLALLNLPSHSKSATGSRKLNRLFDQLARRNGFANHAASFASGEAERVARLTQRIRRAAHDRLDAMFRIDLEEERRYARVAAVREKMRPLYERGELELVE